LEAAYLSFRHSFSIFTCAFDRVLMIVDLFYEPKVAGPSSSLRELVNELLDPEHHRITLSLVEDVVSRCNHAYRILQDEALPLLSELSSTLQTFADASVRRNRQLRERSAMPIPNILLNLVLGSVPIVNWTIPEITAFLDDFARTRRTLERLPSLVQNFQGYFLRLSEDGVDKLGYTSMADLERLADDHAICLQYARMMLNDWLNMS
jgi:hypothetical protein